MQIAECYKCRHRFAKPAKVSSCPNCKSLDNGELGREYRPTTNLSPDSYMNLWRFAKVHVALFNELCEESATSEMTRCPTCDTYGFIHDGECQLGKLVRAEVNACNSGQVIGATWNVECKVCKGKLLAVSKHPGFVPNSMPCKASMGCKGTMTAYPSEEKEADKWTAEFYRPTNLGGLDEETRKKVLLDSVLVLRKLPRNKGV